MIGHDGGLCLHLRVASGGLHFQVFRSYRTLEDVFNEKYFTVNFFTYKKFYFNINEALHHN